MARQEQLDGGFAGIETAIVYYRPAKSHQKTIKPDRQPIETASELEEVGELLDYIKRQKLRYPVPLSESNMDELTHDQATKIVDQGPNEMYVRQILSLFCSSLEGKQKMENKYAMLIHTGDGFLLAHVKAERGMSLKEEEGEIELIRRFLDIDNILSAALFEDDDGEIVFSHFTDTGSDAFRDFLGVRKRQYHYEKKSVQIVCYYRGNREVEAKFEFSNDEFDNLWLQEQSVELSGDQFTPVKDDRSHTIKEIRWGNEEYESVERFQSDFKEYSFGLDGERTRYDRIHQYPSDDIDHSVFGSDIDRVIDHRHRIEFVDTESQSEFIEKGGLPDNLHVIYANHNISIESGFADAIFQDIINDLDRDLYHPSEEAAADELEVNNISFLNIDERDISSELYDFVNSVHNHAVTRTGETVSKCLTIVMFHALEREVGDEFQDAINQIINVNSGNPKDRAVVSTKENEGPDLIEYKNKLTLENGDAAQAIVDEIKTEKGKQNDAKIFLFGFTEQNRRIDGFDTQSWNDDRLSNIEGKVIEQLNQDSLDFNEFILQPIELGHKGDRWAVTGILF